MALQGYEMRGKLGQGTYGTVYLAIEKATQTVVALKKMRNQQDEEGIPVSALREVSLLRNLSHPNIIGVREVISKNDYLAMVIEYVDIDLKKYMDTQRAGLPPPLLRSYAFQLLCGLCYLHSHRVMHRDVKPTNLLINRDGLLKICDFGLARMFSLRPREYTSEVVTLWYRPPELMLGAREYDVSVDMWSAACVIAEMVTGAPLFPGDSDIDQLNRVFRVTGTPDENAWPGLQALPEYRPSLPVFQKRSIRTVLGTDDPLLEDLVERLLQNNPARRISAMQALSHPYFASVPTKLIEMCAPAGVPIEFPKL